MKDSGTPSARRDGLVVREVAGEVLVYDLERHEAHCLNASAAAVWRSCDGSKTVAQITAELRRELDPSIDEDVVWVALSDLWTKNLLQGQDEPKTRSGLSRASLLKRAGVGAAALSLPAITSLVAPTVAHAVSNLPPGACCNGSTECASGICNTVGQAAATCQGSGFLGACS